ncbi:MAG TPA: PilN domain-containing protein [Candidatus Saccharimonadales bacterium]|nr:PilN domain-containing protein [Candidatus Saccharimonadales bacterium]
MVELNLLPDVKREYIETQHLKRNIIALSILAILISIAVVVLMAFYVNVVQSIAQTNVKNDITKSTTQLHAIPQLSKILTVQDALSTLPTLKSQQVINSRLFAYLTDLVPTTVALNKLDIEQSATSIEFDGVSQDYTSLNVFADDLKDAQLTYGPSNNRQTIQPFSKVVITSADQSNNTTTPGVSFQITMNFNSVIFAQTTTSPTINIPNINPNQQFAQSGQIFGGNGQ